MNISKFSFNNLEIEHISKSNLKNYTISLKPKEDNVTVIVKTPKNTSKTFVLELLKNKELWINKNIEKLTKKTILKLSEKVNLSYTENYLSKRVKYFAQLMQLSYKELRFKNLKSRWGSCDTRGIITLNYQLIKIEKELIDYVIVHELTHLIEMNHSKKFHAITQHYLADANDRRKKLKESYTLVR